MFSQSLVKFFFMYRNVVNFRKFVSGARKWSWYHISLKCLQTIIYRRNYWDNLSSNRMYSSLQAYLLYFLFFGDGLAITLIQFGIFNMYFYTPRHMWYLTTKEYKAVYWHYQRNFSCTALNTELVNLSSVNTSFLKQHQGVAVRSRVLQSIGPHLLLNHSAGLMRGLLTAQQKWEWIYFK